MSISDKQLDDFMDEVKFRLRKLVRQMVEEQHAELYAEFKKLEYQYNELKKIVKGE